MSEKPQKNDDLSRVASAASGIEPAKQARAKPDAGDHEKGLLPNPKGSLPPWPTDLTEPAAVLLSKVTGGDVPNARAARAAWTCAGVIMGRLLPDPDGGIDVTPRAGDQIQGDGSVQTAGAEASQPQQPGGKVQLHAAMHAAPKGAAQTAAVVQLPQCTDEEGKAALEACCLAQKRGTDMEAMGPLAQLVLRQALAYALKLFQQWVAPA